MLLLNWQCLSRSVGNCCGLKVIRTCCAFALQRLKPWCANLAWDKISPRLFDICLDDKAENMQSCASVTLSQMNSRKITPWRQKTLNRCKNWASWIGIFDLYSLNWIHWNGLWESTPVSSNGLRIWKSIRLEARSLHALGVYNSLGQRISDPAKPSIKDLESTHMGSRHLTRATDLGSGKAFD